MEKLQSLTASAEWDGDTLVIIPKRGQRLRFDNQKRIELTADQIQAAGFSPAGRMRSGEVLLLTDTQEYRLQMMSNHQDGWQRIAEALAPEGSAEVLAARNEFNDAAKRLDGTDRRGLTVQSWKPGVIDIRPGNLVHKGSSYPLPATARVETAGDIQKRVTATRLVAVGVFAFAFKKKKDARELYLSVEGTGPGNDWAFVVDVDPSKGKEARDLAARINSASAPGSPLAPERPAEPVPAAAEPVADQLVKLADLHQSGALSDDEFAAAKARLLA